MNLVLDDAAEVHAKKQTRKELGTYTSHSNQKGASCWKVTLYVSSWLHPRKFPPRVLSEWSFCLYRHIPIPTTLLPSTHTCKLIFYFLHIFSLIISFDTKELIKARTFLCSVGRTIQRKIVWYISDVCFGRLLWQDTFHNVIKCPLCRYTCYNGHILQCRTRRDSFF